jgi:hypothetical protein
MKYQLNGIHVSCYANQGCLFLFNKGSDLTQSIANNVRSLGRRDFLSCCLLRGDLLQSVLLFSSRLRSVLVKYLEKLSSSLSVDDTRLELIDGWRNLDSLIEDSFLSLDSNVSRPLDESGQISLVSDVLSDTKVSWFPLDERIDLLLLGGSRPSSLLSSDDFGQRSRSLPPLYDLLYLNIRC